jgi:hypothetical protein
MTTTVSASPVDALAAAAREYLADGVYRAEDMVQAIFYSADVCREVGDDRPYCISTPLRTYPGDNRYRTLGEVAERGAGAFGFDGAFEG